MFTVPIKHQQFCRDLWVKANAKPFLRARLFTMLFDQQTMWSNNPNHFDILLNQ